MSCWRERATAWLDGLIEDIDDDHPEAVSRLDALDGVGATRTRTRTGMPHPRKTEGDDGE